MDDKGKYTIFIAAVIYATTSVVTIVLLFEIAKFLKAALNIVSIYLGWLIGL